MCGIASDAVQNMFYHFSTQATVKYYINIGAAATFHDSLCYALMQGLLCIIRFLDAVMVMHKGTFNRYVTHRGGVKLVFPKPEDPGSENFLLHTHAYTKCTAAKNLLCVKQ